MGLIDKVLGRLVSESGTFLCKDGIVTRFIPHPSNLIKGGVDKEWPDRFGHTDGRHYGYAVRTLIVPEGVRGFCTGFLMGGAVTETLRFPGTLEEIGRLFEWYDDRNRDNVFAGAWLPEVEIPASVRHLGCYSFGGARIGKLVLHAPLPDDTYMRQFKECHIEELWLPESLYDECRRSRPRWLDWLTWHGSPRLRSFTSGPSPTGTSMPE